MRIARIDLRRAPGIQQGFVLEALAPGLNVVLGPNESGKTTLARAVRATLWREEPFEGTVEVEWESERGALVSRRAGSHGPNWTSTSGEAVAPKLPPAHLRGSFFLGLEDLLARGDATESAIAAMLRRELAGGYELTRERLLASWRSVTSTRVKGQHDAVLKASSALAQVRDRHARLAAEEARLEALAAELVAARAARQEASLYVRAKRHAELTRALADAQAECARFPSGMERVPADVERRLEALEAALREARERLDEAQRERRDEERALEALGALARSRAGDAPELDALGARKQRLIELASSIDGLDQRLAAARAKARSAAASPREAREPLAIAELERLDALARQRAQVEQRLVAARAEHDALGGADASPGAEPLATAAARLGAWLDGRAAVESGRARLPWLWAGIAAAAAGALALSGLAAGGALALAAGVALVAVGFSARRAESSAPPQLADLGLAELDEPTAAAAARRIQELGAASARAERGRRGAELARTIARLEADERSSMDERARELARLGLDARLGELAALVVADRLRRAEEAASEAGELAARRAAEQRLLDAELDAVCAALRAVERPEPADVRAAAAAIDGVEAARERAARARASLARIEEREEAARRALRARDEDRTALFHSLALEPNDGDGLRLRAARYAEWRAACEARDKARSALDLLAHDLGEHAELLVLDAAELERRSERARALAEREAPLADEAASIRNACDAARRGTDLGAALAALDAERDALEQRRRELLRARLADFLIGEVEVEHRHDTRPELVRRAGRYFAGATRARYELELADAGEGELPLCVREGRRAVELRALSAGTRAQLGIALRLAVAEQAELGERLPVFFDEVLATSDPERFAALVALASELAREGRQLFYSTADPDEVQRLREALAARGEPAPRVFELGELRRERAAAPALEPREARRFPSPGDATPEEYLALVGASAMDPFASADELHLGHLFFDDLPALHRMLCDGAETVGRARRFLELGWTRAWDRAQRERFELRARAVKAFFDAWRVGRGKQLDEETLRASSAVSKTFADALVAVAAREGWDAAHLLECVREGELKGFRSGKAQELEDELAALGHLDPAPRLDEAGCLDRVARALEPELRDGAVALSDLRAWIARWWGIACAPRRG